MTDGNGDARTGPDTPSYLLEWARAVQAHTAAGEVEAAEALLARIRGAGYRLRQGPDGPTVVVAAPSETVAPDSVEDRRDQPDSADLSVLLTLEAHGLEPEPGWVVADARRCLSGVLATLGQHRIEIIVVDDGVGGAAGQWVADAVRGRGIQSVHLAHSAGPVGARAVHARVATGKILLWLDTSVELTADAYEPLLAAFDDPQVGLVGRWGYHLTGLDIDLRPVAAGGPRSDDVDVVDLRLLALRRDLIRTTTEAQPDVGLDPGYQHLSYAAADLAFRVRRAGARTRLVELPASAHGHRVAAAVPADVSAAHQRQDRLRLADRWQDEIEQRVG